MIWNRKLWHLSVQFSSVAQSCPTLCDAMNHSMPGLSVHQQLPEFTQTQVHWVGDAIQPSHPLSSPSLPALNLSQHQGLYNESSLRIRWPKYWSFSFNISPSNEHLGLISFRMDWLDLLAVQGTLKSLLQHHSWKASILWCSAFFIVQLSHPYMLLLPMLLLNRFSPVRLCATPQMAAHQAAPSLGFPGKNTEVGCHFLLQCMKVKSGSEVAQSCPTLCDPIDCSTPGIPVYRQLPEFTQTHVRWVSGATNHLILCLPLLLLPSIFPSIRAFSNESALCIRWPKY